ncbi:UNVERIFIED_CONTAM: hypothetical protein NY603_39875, partial [Bacteroidetes bacterium 56_B9]
MKTKKQKNMETTIQSVYLNIPKADMKFFKELAKKMGWSIETKESLLKNYISKRPTKVELSDEDIMEEINA